MADIEHRHLRSALDFAVMMAGEGQKHRPPIPFPRELKAFVGAKRIPTKALGKLRRAIENDEAFRNALAVGAVPELVDEVGRLWLSHAPGWENRAQALVDDLAAAESADDARQALKRSEKQRTAAEAATARTRAELIRYRSTIDAHRSEIDELNAELAKVAEEAAELRAELVDARTELRHTRDRGLAASEKLAAAERERDLALSDRSRASEVRDDVLAARVEAVGSVAEIADAAQAAQALANRLESLLPRTGETTDVADRPPQRTPLSLPGGVLSQSAEAGEYYVRSDAAVFVDGYNVSKLAWHGRTLEQQRRTLLDAAENLARRFGTDITVVFDGASVVGAHAERRRLVRVVYSPEGVIADDVIRDEVRRLPTSRAVVVVTNDKEIVRDVRAEGANTLPSNAFIAIL